MAEQHEEPTHDEGPDYLAAAQHTLAALGRLMLAGETANSETARNLSIVGGSLALASIAESLAVIAHDMATDRANVQAMIETGPKSGDKGTTKAPNAATEGRELVITEIPGDGTLVVERTDRPGIKWVILADDWTPS